MKGAAGPVLGIDTATARTGLALVSGEQVLAEASFHRRISPSRALMPVFQVMLETAGLQLSDLASLAVTVGPGGFTGIRVGLATTRALAEACGRPLAGVSTLAALAASDGTAGLALAPWLDAGRREVYAGLFRDGQATAAEEVAVPEAVLAGLPAEPLCFIGDGARRYADLIAARPGAHPDDVVHDMPLSLATAVARLGHEALEQGDALPPRPRYLRPPDATRARS